jgi:hypothetical protein
MTSQVVLFNKLGVAVASDSAVTSFRGKVLNGSEKIFDVGLPHKLAVLTSGLSTFMEYPWEVVLSAWSETLDQPLPNLGEYRDSLNKFLRTISSNGTSYTRQEVGYIFREINEVSEEVLSLFHEHFYVFFENELDEVTFTRFKSNEWDEEFRTYISEKVPSGSKESLISHLKERIESRSKYSEAAGVSASKASVWIEDYWAGSETTFDKYYLHSWPLIHGFQELVNEYIASRLRFPLDENSSEICLVGYGSHELFPSTAFFRIFGSLNGTLIKTDESYWQPTPYAQRLFFGQSDAVQSLFSGDDHLFTSTAENVQRRVLGTLAEKLAANNDESAVFVKDYIEQSMADNAMSQELREVGRQKRGEPFYRAIGMAPIADLAEFASQLVGVQAAYASMNQDNPTVGGTIDVAIITHRDGFRWIRHKG